MATELLRHLLALTLASSLGIITALALRALTRRLFGAGASYSLWLLVPIAMLSVLLPQVPATGSQSPIASLSVTSTPLTHVVGKPLESLVSAAATPFYGALWTVGVWGLGVAIFAVYLVALQRAFVRSLGTLSGVRCVRRADHSVGCPALIGVLRPKVILPADFRVRYTRLERLLVLAHERTHLRRGDAGWNALVALMRCTFWFNPLIHVAARYFRFDQELACDAAVLAARRGSRRPYATAMLKTQLTEGALPIGCHWRSAQDLKERLRMVSRRAPDRRRRRFGRALTMLLAGIVAYTAWAEQPVAGSTTRPATSATTADRPVVGWMAGLAGWLTLPNQTRDQPGIMVIRDARLFLASGATMIATADMAGEQEAHLHGHVSLRAFGAVTDEQGRPQTLILEGHVHLAFTSPYAGAASPQTAIVDTNRAVLVGHSDGSSEVRVDEATVQTDRPQAVAPPQTLPLLLTRSRITPQFGDADVSQVAAAVSLATHRTFIIDPRVHGQITMITTVPMTPEAFYQAFLDILRTRGFVARPVGPEGNAIKIQPAASD
jgi:beta-lactamase regulating signal transducer with metallopeptidase domain